MKGYAHLLYVLVLCQVSTSLLAGIGESLFMGTPLYLLVPVLRGIVLVVAAVCAARTAPERGGPLRRWPLVLLIVAAQLAVIGYMLSNIVGVLPGVSDTVNLVGLLTNLGLPLAITWLAARSLAGWRRPPARPAPVIVVPALVGVPLRPGPYPPRAVVPTPLPVRPALPRTLVDPLAPVPGPMTAEVPASLWAVEPVSPASGGAAPDPGAVTRMLPRDGVR